MGDFLLIVSSSVALVAGLVAGLLVGLRLGWRDQDTTVARLQGMLRRSERDLLASRRECDALQSRMALRIVTGGRHAG